jgi:hypothetical protein
MTFTQSAIVLENLINKLFSNIASGGSKDSGSSGNPTPDQGGKD